MRKKYLFYSLSRFSNEAFDILRVSKEAYTTCRLSNEVYGLSRFFNEAYFHLSVLQWSLWPVSTPTFLSPPPLPSTVDYSPNGNLTGYSWVPHPTQNGATTFGATVEPPKILGYSPHLYGPLRRKLILLLKK